MQLGFDQEKYLNKQSKYIIDRVNNYDKLYLEFGGKLIRDTHAKRVLPGYNEDAKIKLLQKMKEDVEVIICVYSGHIQQNKVIGDSGISYDLDVFRLIDDLRRYSLDVNSVVITRYEENPATDTFIKKLERRNIKTYKHKPTPGYPTDLDKIVSEDGYGKNPYIVTSKKIVVVTAPGPGSGKLATCLSQLYHEYLRGNNAGYSKFETFPIWDLPLKHPLNVAYESATADLKDINMIDSYHMEAYNKVTTNYNRDIESFPLLKRMLEKITGKSSVFKSPTDMGVNMISTGIIDDDIVSEASKQEIIRRYMISECDYIKGECDLDMVDRLKLLMENLGLKIEDRKVIEPARKKAEKIKRENENNDENIQPSVIAIELHDGTMLTGKSTTIMDASAATLLNAIKYLANIPDDIMLISPVVLEPIQKLKKSISSTSTTILNAEEIMIALSICAATNPIAQRALSKLNELKNTKAHSTTIMNPTDENFYGKLEIYITSDPIFPSKQLYYDI